VKNRFCVEKKPFLPTQRVENASTSKQSLSNVEFQTEASELPCTMPTTNLQRKPTAEPKTAVSAKSYGR
jgi:hypothetical protein